MRGSSAEDKDPGEEYLHGKMEQYSLVASLIIKSMERVQRSLPMEGDILENTRTVLCTGKDSSLYISCSY